MSTHLTTSRFLELVCSHNFPSYSFHSSKFTYLLPFQFQKLSIYAQSLSEFFSVALCAVINWNYWSWKMLWPAIAFCLLCALRNNLFFISFRWCCCCYTFDSENIMKYASHAASVNGKLKEFVSNDHFYAIFFSLSSGCLLFN